MCNCVNDVREGVKENDPSVTSVMVDLSNITEYQDGKPKIRNKTGQKITVYYDHTLKNGIVRRKKRNSFVDHDFCPWCGKRYK